MADSSPLIALCRIRRLELLRNLSGRLIIPDAVWEEVSVSHPEKEGAKEVLCSDRIEQQAVRDIALVRLLRQDLGAGESEAIVLARELQAAVVLMDERRGRTAAKHPGLTCTGLAGVLIVARRRSIITDRAAIAQELRDIAGFWISDELMSLFR